MKSEDSLSKSAAAQIDPDSLLGEHILSGAVMDAARSGAQVLRFTLDGRHYEAEEDPDDGYRSYFRGYITETQIAPFTVFDAAQVEVRKSANSRHECWEFVSQRSGKVCMEFGTSDLDDYYPGFVGYIEPHNL